MKPLEVWQPRYSTNDCLILATKVKSDTQPYAIYFSKDKTLSGNRYILRGHEIKTFKKERTIQGNKLCYVIPMDELERYKL